MTLSVHNHAFHLDGRPAHAGSPAEGLLLNVRTVNATFEDEGPGGAAHLPPGFDPDANTNRFISRIPDYADHGVRAFTLSLQGGHCGYEGAVNSAFDGDGSLRDAYLDRLDRVITAADGQGCAIILSCFYQRQQGHARAFANRRALFDAVGNAARWIRSRAFTNVALEISNEYAHGGYRTWPEGSWLRSPEGQAELIRHVRQAAPGLLVSTSGMGGGTAEAPIAEAADFITIHFNNTDLEAIPERIAAARAFGKPVLCNEDDKIGPIGAEAARLSVVNGAGWGFMHSAKNQYVPFEFDGAQDDPAVYAALKQLTTPGASALALGEISPFVLITRPKDGDVFSSGTGIAIRVAAAGVPSGASVRLLANGHRITDITSSPWRHTWPGAPTGKVDLLAVLLDSSGREIARSRPVDILTTPVS